MVWPILDRPELRQQVLDALELRPRRAVVLRGPSGIGKSVVARSVAESWSAAGAPVLHVVGLPELSGAPLTPFASALGALGHRLPPTLTPPDVIAAVGGYAQRGLLVVDDGPLLDEASSAVVYHLVRSYGLPAVVTVRSGHPRSGAWERLAHEGLTTTIDVGGLSRSEIESVLRVRLGAAVRPDDVGRLEQQTSGNPLHLRELVDLAERWGQIRTVTAGIAIDSAGLPAALGDSVVDRVQGLGDEALRVLRLVARGAGAPLEVLVRSAAEARTADLLEQDGFIVRRLDGTVRLGHPAYGEAALRGLTEGEGDRVVQEVASRLHGAGDDLLRFTAVRLSCSTRSGPSTGELVWAVSHAYARGEHLVARDLAALVVARSESLGFAAQVDLASSLSALGEKEDAERAFGVAEALARGSGETALLLSRWGNHLAYRGFDVAAALALAARLGSRLAAAERELIGPDLRTWQILAGEVVADRRPALGVSEDAPPAVVVRAAIAAVMLDSMSGRLDSEAAEQLARVEAEHGVLDPFAADMVHLQRYFTLLSQGDGAGAEEVCVRRRACCTPDGVGMWSLTLGIHLQYGGRLHAARQLAETAVEQLRWRDPLGLLGFAVALHALVLAQVDRPRDAEEQLSGLLPAQLGDPKAAMLVAETKAHLRYASGDPDGAAALLVEAAAAAADAGHDLVAAIGLGLCLRFDRAEAALDALTVIQSRVGAGLGLYDALEGAARGLVSGDPVVVLEAARRLADAGMGAAALDALVLAEAQLPARGRGELRRKFERARREVGQAMDFPSWHVVDTSGQLSDREWEVVLRAADRRTSREIADELGIAVRTVENHLAKAYRKLGVSGRTELRAVLSTP